MIPLSSRKYGYTYHFNAKSASSTFRSLFLELHRGELPEPLRDTVNIHNAFQHFHPVAMGGAGGKFNYTIVRHPFPRIVSAYLDKCVEINTPRDARFQEEHHLQWIFDPIFKYLQRAPDLARGFSFVEFLHYLEYAFGRRQTVDVHFQAQSNPRVSLDAYHRIEDPVDGLLAIYRQVFGTDFDTLGLQQKVINASERRLNQSFAQERAVYDGPVLAEADFTSLNALADKGYRLGYESFITAKTRAILSDLFAQDLAAYSYSAD